MQVGRAAERHRTTEAVERAAGGATTLLVIEGEAGIGKTTLLAETAALARAKGFEIRGARCAPLDADRPFGVVLAALGVDGVMADPRGNNDVGVDPIRHEIAALLGEAPDLRSPIVMATAPDLRTRMIDALCTLVEAEALARPVMLAIEDLQWGDPSTLLALRSIARRVEGYRLLIVATHRSGATQRFEWDALRRSASTALTLGPLDAAEIEQLAEAELQGTLGPKLRRLMGTATGNPLLARELLGSAAPITGRVGDVIEIVGEAPASFSASIAQRVASLTASAAEMVHAASVMSDVLDLGTLSSLLDRPVTRLVPLLRESIAAGLLSDDGEDVAFAHDLIREAVYLSLPSAVRRLLHRDVADVLIGSGAPAAAVATHLDRARGATEDTTELRAWLLRAARGALGRAPGVAHALYERAQATVHADDPVRITIAVEQLEAAVNAGMLREGIELGTRLTSADLDDEQSLRLRWWLGGALFLSQRADEAAELFEKAGDAARDDGVRALMLGYATMARLATFAPDVDTLLHRALEISERAGDNHARTLALELQSRASATRLRIGASIAPALDAVAIADADPARNAHRYQPLFMLALALLDNVRFDDAADASRRGRRESGAVGAAWAEVLYHGLDALLAYFTGHDDDAEVEAAAGIAFAEETGSEISVLWCHGITALLALDRGDIERAAAAVQLAEEAFNAGRAKMGIDLVVLARARLLELTDRVGACHLLAETFDLFGALNAELMQERLALPLADLATRCGDVDRANAVAAEVARWATIEASVRVESTSEAVSAVVRGDVVAIERAAEIATAAGMVSDARLLRSIASRHRGTAGSAAMVPNARSAWDSLTPAEQGVAREIARGLSNKQISASLGISTRTVETHVTRMLRKLELTSRLQVGLLVAQHAS